MVCVVSFWVLRASFFLFAFLWCLVEFLRLKRPLCLNTPYGIKEPAISSTAGNHTHNPQHAHPLRAHLLRGLVLPHEWRVSANIKHPPTFIHNHAAPRGLRQLKNERAEGGRDTLRSNHGPTRITSKPPTTPSSACPSCPCLCYYRPCAVVCSCSCRSCARARAILCSCPCRSCANAWELEISGF